MNTNIATAGQNKQPLMVSSATMIERFYKITSNLSYIVTFCFSTFDLLKTIHSFFFKKSIG